MKLNIIVFILIKIIIIYLDKSIKINMSTNKTKCHNSFRKFSALKGITINMKNELQYKNEAIFSPRIILKQTGLLTTKQKINSSLHIIKAGLFELLPEFDKKSKEDIANSPNITQSVKRKISQMYNNSKSVSIRVNYNNDMDNEFNSKVDSKKKEIIEMLSERSSNKKEKEKKSLFNNFRRIKRNYSVDEETNNKDKHFLTNLNNIQVAKLKQMKRMLLKSKTGVNIKGGRNISNQLCATNSYREKEMEKRDYKNFVKEFQKRKGL